ncbi:UDP-4-amino-4,6-dideoxy-N-acetyl-beta-L-altrosamine transaminase [Roseobacter sp. HKCCD7870]|uniref:UDP-4-amino-4, 6-dideoxy-N-acetyl-beta-L-altrosamine transaminase n=1 Tax=Roseobacter sp. HKCCD7870 TaxID=3120343 RepID=UPI0030EBFC58
MPDEAFLPYGRHTIEADDIGAVVDVLSGEYLTTGPAVEALEAAFCEATGAPHSVACSSGAAGLHLSYLALGLGRGDKVVVPSVTFLATASMAHLAGAEVIFADVDPDTALMTEDTFEAAIWRAGGNVAAVVPVHMCGQMVDMDAIGLIAQNSGIRIVEDACHALGGRDAKDCPTGQGSTSDLTMFSLHPVKTVAGGEGGVVTTADPDLAARMRTLRNHGMMRDRFLDATQATAADGAENPWYYELAEPAFNYRLSDIHAALATSQMSKLERFVVRRAELRARYEGLFAERASVFNGRVRLAPSTAKGRTSWHLCVALFEFEVIGKDRAYVMRALRELGIGTQVHYLPLHRQPWWRQRNGNTYLPGADSWYARCLSLPLFPGMRDEDVDRVVDAITALVRF